MYQFEMNKVFFKWNVFCCPLVKQTKVLLYENLRRISIIEKYKLEFIVLLFLIKVNSKHKNETVIKIVSTEVMT